LQLIHGKLAANLRQTSNKFVANSRQIRDKFATKLRQNCSKLAVNLWQASCKFVALIVVKNAIRRNKALPSSSMMERRGLELRERSDLMEEASDLKQSEVAAKDT
jgi:hypothetical protein